MRKATTNKIESEGVKKLIASPLTPHDLKENKNEEEKIYHRTNLQLLCQNRFKMKTIKSYTNKFIIQCHYVTFEVTGKKEIIKSFMIPSSRKHETETFFLIPMTLFPYLFRHIDGIYTLWQT